MNCRVGARFGVAGLLLCVCGYSWGLTTADKVKWKLRKVQLALYTRLDKLPAKGATVELLTEKSPLCDEEVRFRRLRLPKCAKAQGKLIGRTVAANSALKVGIIFSGGGMRACLVALGALMELAELGIIDASLAIGGLSGSTWAIIPWYLSEKPMAKFYDEHIKRIVSGLLLKNPGALMRDSANFVKIMTKIVARRLTLWEKPTIIDPYSLLLWLSLVDDKIRGEYLKMTLEGILPRIRTGDMPAPVMSLVAPLPDYKYGWVDCWPWAIESTDLGFRLTPPSGLGSEFEAGKEVQRHYAVPVGLLLGAWGSAVSVSLYEALGKTFGALPTKIKPSAMDEQLRNFGIPATLSQARFLPLAVSNPAYKLAGAPSESMATVMMLDGGINYCLGFPPFERESRPFDLLVVVDASGDVPMGLNLHQAALDAAAHDRPFAPVGDGWRAAGEKPFTVFFDETGQAPAIVYFPASVTNAVHPDYDKNFNPRKEIAPFRFMDTFNFLYTKDQAYKLTDFARHMIKEGAGAIKSTMAKILAQKKGGAAPR